MAPRIAGLAALLAAVIAVSGCDPFVMRQLELGQPARPNTATVTLTIASSELAALVEQVAQRHGFRRTSSDRLFVPNAIYVYEGTYEVCGVLACGPKLITIEIAAGDTPADSII